MVIIINKTAVLKWRYVTNKPTNTKDNINNYIEYISKQVEQRRENTGNYIANIDRDLYQKSTTISNDSSINEINNYISYIDSRIGSHELFSSHDADINEIIDEIKKHEGTLWIPIVSLKESYAIDFDIDSEVKWVEKGRELAEIYRKGLNIDKENYGWVAAFHTKPEVSQNDLADAGCQPHLHFILYEKEPDEHKNPNIRHKKLEELRTKTATILSREYMQRSYTMKNELRKNIKEQSKDLSDMRDDIHHLLNDIYVITKGKGKLSVGEFEKTLHVLEGMELKVTANKPFNAQEQFYKKYLNIDTTYSLNNVICNYISILSRLDAMADKLLEKEETKTLVDAYIELSNNMRIAKGEELAAKETEKDIAAIKREIKNSILAKSKELSYSNRFISNSFKGMLLEKCELGHIKNDLPVSKVIDTTKVITTLLKEANVDRKDAKNYVSRLFDTYEDEKRKKMAMMEFNRIYKKTEFGMDVSTIEFWDAMRNINVDTTSSSIYSPLLTDYDLSNSILLEPITRLSIETLDEQKNVLDLNYTQTLLSQSLNSLSYIPKSKEEYEEKYDLLCDAYSSYLESERNQIYENEI